MTSPILASALSTTSASNSVPISNIREPIDQTYIDDLEQQSTSDTPLFSLALPQPIQAQNPTVIGDASAAAVKSIATSGAPLTTDTVYRTNFIGATAIDSANYNAQHGQGNPVKAVDFGSTYTATVNPLAHQLSSQASKIDSKPSTTTTVNSATATAASASASASASHLASSNTTATFNNSVVKPDNINPFLSATQFASAFITKQVDSASIDTIESAHQIIASNTRAQSAVAQWGPVSVSQAAPMLQQAQEMLSPLREQLRFQIDQQIKQAELRLDPPELGKIELNVRLDGDKLHIQMHAANASVRDALLTGLDRLRAELAADHGGQIDVDISQGDSQKQQTQQGTQSAIAAANLQGAQPMTAETSQQDHVDLLA
ncbi:flagellar hook-length control protein FliK [Shewanella sp. KX20019]|uniref:flagellar hook-length control protein FliK n=1 Tax=Shewanella sp. KX20019 TaxID=2803864 RepID=UPI001F259012|nr:flagellar hook-length control protein FliK [Shewanella sp. KX20019]